MEGSNSGERAELSNDTEKQLACFALAVSDLIILNIKADQLFQQSSGISLIKTMKEAAKKVSETKLQTKLLIVLRDFSHELHDETKCRK